MEFLFNHDEPPMWLTNEGEPDENGRRHAPVPENMIIEGHVRFAMEYALGQKVDIVNESTKAIADQAVNLTNIKKIKLEFPVEMPSCRSVGASNEVLRLFAYEALDLILELPRTQSVNWFIATYFEEGDDQQDQICLGLFLFKENGTYY